MSLVCALAASHAPNILLEPGAEWEDFMNLHYSMAPKGVDSRPTLEQQKKLRQDAEAAFAVLRADLEAAKPDVLIVVANDQFVNFFFNVIPTFFVTLADEVKGQFTRHSFQYKNHRELGRAILKAGLDKGIDFAFGEYVELQHTQTVPLYEYLGGSHSDAAPLLSSRTINSGGGERSSRAGGDSRYRRVIPFSRVAQNR
jgi:hypothetical protein